MQDEEMTAGREMDAQVERIVFGREPCTCLPEVGERRYDPMTGLCVICGRKPADRYSTDIAHAYRMEATVAQRGGAGVYCRALALVILYGDGSDDNARFALIHATAEQRCRAAIMAAEVRID